MKTIKLMCLVIALFGLISNGSVWARDGGGHFARGSHHGGHFARGGHHGGYGGYGGRGHYGGGYRGGYGFGLGLGYGLGYRGYGGYYSPHYAYPPPYYAYPYYAYPPPYYAYPPVVGVPAVPPVYIQQQQGVAQPATESQANYWHYCQNPEGYYPYVRKCPDGWLQVSPQPSAQ